MLGITLITGVGSGLRNGCERGGGCDRSPLECLQAKAVKVLKKIATVALVGFKWLSKLNIKVQNHFPQIKPAIISLKKNKVIFILILKFMFTN